MVPNTGGTPVKKDVQVIDSLTEFKLEVKGFSYAIVQILSAGAVFPTPSKICLYNVFNVKPVADLDYLLGDGDVRLFENGELKKGVKLLSNEAGQSVTVIITYYNFQPQS